MTSGPRRRLLLLGAAAGAFNLVIPPAAPRPADRVVKVRARRFVFEPDTIRLARGVPVAFELTSLDVPMGFSVPDFGVRSDIMPGKVTRLQMTPDRVGEFSFNCDIFCGSGHETMAGTIVVS